MSDTEQPSFRFHVVFNNVAYRTGLVARWGFACLIESPGRTVLFDTGGDGAVLLGNMERLGLDAGEIDAVVLSHVHGDHTGGLRHLLERRPAATVYMPGSFPASFQREVKRMAAAAETVTGPGKLMDHLYSTGEMGRGVKEQALIVDTPAGLVVVTGCAHPNVADMAEQAGAQRGRTIHLLMGGFHLGGRSDAEIREIIRRLQALGVEKVAPSHCTGERATAMFREAWGEDFVEGGLGAVIEVSGQL